MKTTKCNHCVYGLNSEQKMECLLCGNVSNISLITEDLIKLGYSDAIIIEKANPALIQLMDCIIKEERKNIATR
jgi:hypothetical protein